ncbi:MAG: hypothetical protein HC806_00810 [Anaerolineae bacterium]|nr:hypothetical protein [Anaerolineae bacterium]
MEQLHKSGRLVAPIGGEKGQVLERWTRRGTRFKHEKITPVSFVPLRGKLGWQEKEWKS